MATFWLNLFFLCCYLCVIGVIQVHSHSDDECGAQEMIDLLLSVSTDYQAAVDHENEVCDNFVESVAGQHRFCRDMGSSSDSNRRRLARQARRLQLGDFEDSIYIVPIIFHVMYKTNAENIPMSQIDSQMDVINEDFRSINYEFDTNLNDPLWNDRVGDIRVKFVKQAVYRYPMPSTFDCSFGTFSNEQQIKLSAYGGVDSINPDQFVNFWICDLNGAAGYAYFPCPTDQWLDGVVQDYLSVGSKRDNDGTFQKSIFASSRDYGRTGSHELGHYLNLPHIWGFNTGCGGDDDGVADTPFQDAPNSHVCPADTTNSCFEIDPITGVDMRDMYENIMDYSRDECRFMFSEGQATRMRAVLEPGGCRTAMKTEWTPPAECDNNPCLPFEAGFCAIYHTNTGCSQCQSGSFKKNYNYPCVDCQEAFGDDCIFCADFGGCCQCTANTHNLVHDPVSGLYYCEPTPCYYPELHCKDCNNGGCCQCEQGYTLIDGACYAN